MVRYWPGEPERLGLVGAATQEAMAMSWPGELEQLGLWMAA